MSLLDKIKSKIKDDWCDRCAKPMILTKKQLFVLPTMTVGHFSDHNDSNYYVKNLVKISSKSEVPTGMYACHAYLYHCPACGRKVAKLVLFLPVRDQEQIDAAHLFEDPKLLNFLN